ncbi:MAG: nuclear transport factor 2 family protein [Chitinophagaceae bacterium]|nr:nuclear transport factor 2 family protein [Chitinophagaceae bacterium]
MKYGLVIFTLFHSLTVLAQEGKDSIEIVQLLKEDYKTMQTHDINKHRGYCTSNYLLIENGEIWDMDKEADGYKKDANRIIDRKDNFNFKFIRIFDNIAYAVYNLKSDIIENGNVTQKNWNESVIFRKIEGNWKIELIHSTPVDIK